MPFSWQRFQLVKILLLGFGLSVELHGNFPHLSKEEAIKLMEDAHQACPYSKATRGNIDVLLSAN